MTFKPPRLPALSGGALMALLGSPLLPGGPVQACEAEATPIFSCEAAGGRKFIELCAFGEPGSMSGLQYRFGAQTPASGDGTLELEFPEELPGSLSRFLGAVYRHRGVYTQSVRFNSAGFSYTVFTKSWRDADSAEGMAGSSGVAVRNLRTGKSTTVDCSERPRFYIFELQGVLACDPETPVGRACIQ